MARSTRSKEQNGRDRWASSRSLTLEQRLQDSLADIIGLSFSASGEIRRTVKRNGPVCSAILRPLENRCASRKSIPLRQQKRSRSDASSEMQKVSRITKPRPRFVPPRSATLPRNCLNCLGDGLVRGRTGGLRSSGRRAAATSQILCGRPGFRRHALVTADPSSPASSVIDWSA